MCLCCGEMLAEAFGATEIAREGDRQGRREELGGWEEEGEREKESHGGKGEGGRKRVGEYTLPAFF